MNGDLDGWLLSEDRECFRICCSECSSDPPEA